MLTDTEIKQNGIKALIDRLGIVEAERFITLVHRETFDYTTWRKKLWQGKSIRDISQDAMRFREENE
ncbi:MAG: hypothetical protein SCK70_15030 [bacterium]|nr:hypothetical protein [bacterium]